MNKTLQELQRQVKKFIKKLPQISAEKTASLVVIIGLAFLFLIFFSYHLAYWQKIYPGITVLKEPIGNQTLGKAAEKIESQIGKIELKTLPLVYQEQAWPLDPHQLDFTYEATATAQKAYQVGRTGSFTQDLKAKTEAWFQGVNLNLNYQLSQNLLEDQVATIAGELFIPAIEPTIQVFEATPAGALSRIAIEAGKEGRELDQQKLLLFLEQRLATADFDPLELPVIILSPSLTDEQIARTKTRAEKFLDKKLVFSQDKNQWELGEQELIGFLSFTNHYEEEKIASYTATLAQNIDRPPQNAAFQFEGGRVTQFQPAKEGLTLKQEETIKSIIAALEKIEAGEENQPTINLLVITAPPEVTVEEINDLGIKELLGRGVSYFRGSIASRIHNIQLASSRFNGLLIPPGETFSFNQALGEVSPATGFQQAYIIKEGRTILGDGGGVCQVSTTFFRAALDAGLPIIERQAHAYRVAYYEQGFSPGLDATVWEPSPDLKIKNDTPAHILVQAYANVGARSLTFEFYGTSDSRQATIGKSRIWDQVPPPPDLYQDDPTLPAGQIKQIDWKAWGAKVAFDWKVVRGDEVLQDRTFYSNYRPWQAVFLQGTGPAQ
jgi:vancomycin resistance protein YoaR